MVVAGKTWIEIIKKLPKRQQDVLGHIAINEDGGHPQQTLKVLLAKGLIVEQEEKQPGLVIKHYAVPVWVHIAWCEWCSQQVTDEEIE